MDGMSAIAQGLQGFGAGLAGNGVQWQNANTLARSQEEEMRAAREAERKQAFFTDVFTSRQMAEAGDWQGIQQLNANRLEQMQRLGGPVNGTDEHTRAMYDLARIVNTATDPQVKKQAEQHLTKTLNNYTDLGVAQGLLKPLSESGGGAKKTDTFKNGAVLQAMADGAMRLTLPSGQQVTPDMPEWAQGIANAANSGISYAGATTAAQEAARLGYAGPIAAATTGAEQGVKGATEPQIQADIVAAKAGATAGADADARLVKAKQVYPVFAEQMTALKDAFKGTNTGPLAGRFSGLTESSQKAKAARDITEPLLKSVVREAGEGTFSDGDRAQIAEMLPEETDHPSVVEYKVNLLDNFVRGKLGVPAEGFGPEGGTTSTGGFKVLSVK